MFPVRDIVLSRKQHIKYFQRFLHLLPARLSSYDSTRLTIAFFAISGLDVLNALDVLGEEKKKHIIDWIYRLQVLPDGSECNESWSRCGFQGSSTFIVPQDEMSCSTIYECGHLAMTYTGLASLVILGDDLSRINRAAIIEGVRALQQEDGSFCATLAGSESDMRFVYCAACVCYILHDWSGIDIEKTISYIMRSMSYDYGIAQAPELESHGGTTFCAVATVALMNQLDTCFTHKQLGGLRRWGLFRQISGFQGRPNKSVDTCYSFWLGAVLKILGVFDLIDYQENRDYILSTQDPITGGLSKWVNTTPDPLHTYMGLCGLSLMKCDGLLEVHPALNITQRAHEHLDQLHRKGSNTVKKTKAHTDIALANAGIVACSRSALLEVESWLIYHWLSRDCAFMSEGFKARDIGLRAQKKILSRMANKNVAKVFIDETTSSLLDNVYKLAKAYTGNKKEAEKLVKNMIKVVIKLGVLYRNGQFSSEELKQAERFKTRFHSAAMAVVSFYEVDFSYDRLYLLSALNESRATIRQLVQRHLTEKSLTRIDSVFGFFSNPNFLDAVFKKDSEYREILGRIVADMNHAMDEGGM